VVGPAVRQLRSLRTLDSQEPLLSAVEDSVLSKLSDCLTSSTQAPGDAFKLIDKVLTTWPEANVDRDKSDFSALCLLRLLVLQPSAYAYMSADGETRTKCLDAVIDALKETKATPKTVALRLTVVANLFAHASGEEFVLSRLVAVRDAAISHLSSNDIHTRQMASACLHNIVLSLKSFSEECLFGCLERLSVETDEVVVLRRSIAAGVLLRRFSQNAITLVKSQGLDAVVAATLAKSHQQGSNGETKKALRELNRLLSA